MRQCAVCLIVFSDKSFFNFLELDSALKMSATVQCFNIGINCLSLRLLLAIMLCFQDWEKATAGLMVTSTILMGLAVIFSGYLMIQMEAKTGIMSDLSPLIVGNVAGMSCSLVYNLFLHEFKGS